MFPQQFRWRNLSIAPITHFFMGGVQIKPLRVTRMKEPLPPVKSRVGFMANRMGNARGMFGL
jgi:hypothetical protein